MKKLILSIFLFQSVLANAGNPIRVSPEFDPIESTTESVEQQNQVQSPVIAFMLVGGRKDWFEEKEKGEKKVFTEWSRQYIDGNGEKEFYAFHIGAGYLITHEGTPNLPGIGIDADATYVYGMHHLKADGGLTLTNLGNMQKGDVNGHFDVYYHPVATTVSPGYAPGLRVEMGPDKVDHFSLDTVGVVVPFEFDGEQDYDGSNFAAFAVGPYWKKLREKGSKGIAGFQMHAYTYFDGPELINFMTGIQYGVRSENSLVSVVNDIETRSTFHDLRVDAKLLFNFDGIKVKHEKTGVGKRVPVGLFVSADYMATWLKFDNNSINEVKDAFREKTGIADANFQHYGVFLFGLNIGMSRNLN